MMGIEFDSNCTGRKIGRTPFGFGQHPISMSSAADVEPGGTVAFTVKNLGDWSGEVVPKLSPGDTLWIDGPYGVLSIIVRFTR